MSPEFMFLLRRPDGSLYENVMYLTSVGGDSFDTDGDLSAVRHALRTAYPDAEILMAAKVS